ncbi:hypothetical protein EVAR_92529_1 [Eumeta japonica]|uniref:Uncharacterized protein n=1 Tax=Eumeta variegata TaxID=151549 RepID=A0A4C1T8X4_EUMVA|nr:hypothetical protein EVAR_92529_1 [Eumeta japonica]
MIHKQGNWVPCELKPRDVARRIGAGAGAAARHKSRPSPRIYCYGPCRGRNAAVLRLVASLPVPVSYHRSWSTRGPDSGCPSKTYFEPAIDHINGTDL